MFTLFQQHDVESSWSFGSTTLCRREQNVHKANLASSELNRQQNLVHTSPAKFPTPCDVHLRSFRSVQLVPCCATSTVDKHPHISNQAQGKHPTLPAILACNKFQQQNLSIMSIFPKIRYAAVDITTPFRPGHTAVYNAEQTSHMPFH